MVASIKPVHSLVAAVMQGAGAPTLVVEGAGSPHSYSLRPSQAARLQDADLVFWIGHELEAFLEKPIESIASRARVVALIEAQNLIRREVREGASFAAHEEEGDAAHGHAHDDGHDHGATDPHVWLDPLNAKAFVDEIAAALIAADPANAATYRANAGALAARLDALTAEVDALLAPVRGKGFIVFHDAYQYFETRFGVSAAGAITLSPDVMPGADRIAEVRRQVSELGAACVFAEPQFEAALVSVVTEGTGATSAVLDPLGAGIADGPDLYFELIRNMARSIHGCLSGQG